MILDRFFVPAGGFEVILIDALAGFEALGHFVLGFGDVVLGGGQEPTGGLAQIGRNAHTTRETARERELRFDVAAVGRAFEPLDRLPNIGQHAVACFVAAGEVQLRIKPAGIGGFFVDRDGFLEILRHALTFKVKIPQHGAGLRHAFVGDLAEQHARHESILRDAVTGDAALGQLDAGALLPAFGGGQQFFDFRRDLFERLLDDFLRQRRQMGDIGRDHRGWRYAEGIGRGRQHRCGRGSRSGFRFDLGCFNRRGRHNDFSHRLGFGD